MTRRSDYLSIECQQGDITSYYTIRPADVDDFGAVTAFFTTAIKAIKADERVPLALDHLSQRDRDAIADLFGWTRAFMDSIAKP